MFEFLDICPTTSYQLNHHGFNDKVKPKTHMETKQQLDQTMLGFTKEYMTLGLSEKFNFY